MKIHKKQCKNNKLKIIVTTLKGTFQLRDASYSVPGIQDHSKYIIIIKKHKKLPFNPAFFIYVNKMADRVMFIIKHGYQPELQTPETMKLFGSTQKLTGKTKTNENVPSHRVFEVVLVQYNLTDNQY